MQFPTSALLRRELLTTLRSVRTFLLLVAAVGIIFIVVSFYLAAVNEAYKFGAPGGGQAILGPIVIGLYVLMLLCIPPMAASTIVSERTKGNYDMLMTTLIPPIGVWAGKVAHIVGIYLLLVIAVLPLVGVAYFNVGIEWPQLVMAALAIGTSSLAVCCLAFYASCLINSTRGAVLIAYVLVLLFLGLLPIMIYIPLRMLAASFVFPLPEWIALIVFPPAALLVAIEPLSAPAGAVFFWHNLAYQGGWVVLFVLLALGRLRRPWEPATPGAAGDRIRRAMGNPNPGRGRSLPPISLRSNAVHLKDLRVNRLARGKMRVVFWLISFVACFSLNAWAFNPRQGDDLQYVVLFMQQFVVFLLAPASIAPAFAREWERQSVDMLRMTLLWPVEIAWGKYRAAHSMVFTLYTASLAALLVADAFFEVPVHFYFYFIQTAVLMWFALALGGAIGARFRRTGIALVAAYLGGFVLLVVVPYILLFGVGFIFMSVQGDPPMMVFGLYPPVLLIPFQAGREEAAIGYWGLLFTALYSLGLFQLYWRAGARNLTREPKA